MTTDERSTGVPIPATMEEAIDPDWLSSALAGLSGGAPVVSVELAEVIRTMASKVRIRVRFENTANIEHAFCLKAFWGTPGGGGLTTIREGRFYREIAPLTTMRLPTVPAILLDEERGEGILVMDDLVVAGARFCTALEPFTPELAVQSLDQLARLHSLTAPLETTDWLPNRIEAIAARPHYSAERLQALLDDGRASGLRSRTRSAGLVHDAMRSLAVRNRSKSRGLVHGDCHAGNLFQLPDGLGFTDWQLIQKGHWALDVAYHISAVLTVGEAEIHEKALLREYLALLERHGAAAPDWDEAWSDYRAAQIYGYYHWAITTRGEPPVMKIFTERLGASVERNQTFDILGI
ncbi:phosphotransferase family protein [Novosphingobium kaempferiae]|uniref:phosphotransferase family protein n=1 Tax=Novosphingobium kaempferiae TaxID=2896849 RepID=UPI001E61E1F2|nr:ecdysteroid 22-kinase family protein [Novosphingobium kaempferiae]